MLMRSSINIVMGMVIHMDMGMVTLMNMDILTDMVMIMDMATEKEKVNLKKITSSYSTRSSHV